jgi:hypothetical protein
MFIAPLFMTAKNPDVLQWVMVKLTVTHLYQGLLLSNKKMIRANWINEQRIMLKETNSKRMFII